MNPIVTQLVVRETMRERIADTERRRAFAVDDTATPLHHPFADLFQAIRPRRPSSARTPARAGRGA